MIDEKKLMEKFDQLEPHHMVCVGDLRTIIEGLNQEPKTGHWIYDDECKEHGHCSECGHGGVDLVDGAPHNYCQNCGAKMEESKE